MTNEDRMELLKQAVADSGSQSKVAKILGYSAATVSQVLKRNYGGQLDVFLKRVEECFDAREIACPMLGSIPFPDCVTERRKPFCTANPHQVRMYQTCRKCPYNTDDHSDK